MKSILRVSGWIFVLLCWLPNYSICQEAASSLYGEFRNPPREYTVAPFWSWNGTLEPEKIRWQIEQMVEKGIYGAFMHARAGNDLSKTPYFSKGWWDAVETAILTGKEKGFSTFLYDEDKWPSGSAGGRVRAADSMANSKKALRYEILSVHGPASIELKSNGAVIAVVAVQPGMDGSLKAETLTDVTDFAGKNWEAPRGEWQVWIFTQHIEEDGVNYLRKQTVRTFMDITHEEYYRRFGKYFGNVIPGMFFDEISAGPHQSDLVWTDNFLFEFQQRKGYDLRKYLPVIFRNAGTGTPGIRCDYYDVYTQLYTESWFKQISDWCEARGIFLTGHTYEDVNSYMSQGNYFQTWDPVRVPGTDNEDFRYSYPRKIGWFKPKQISGIAHTTGKKRIMGEILGGPGWTVTLEDMRYGVGSLGVYGLNFFIPHLFHYSMETPQAMDDWPNSWFYQNPYWKYFKQFADYIRRVSYMGSQGRHVCDIAILFPVTSQWASGITAARGQLDPGGGAFGGKLQDDYTAVQEALMSDLWDFDAIAPSAFAKSDISAGVFSSGEGEYRVLILPPSTTIERSVLNKILEFHKAGGIIIAAGQLPKDSWEGGANDPEVLRVMWETFRVNPQTSKSGYDETMADLTTEYVVNPCLSNERNADDGNAPGRAYFTKKIPAIPGILLRVLEPDVNLDPTCNGSFAYLHRKIEKMDVYNVMNTGKKEHSLIISFKSSGKPELWDPISGNRTEVHNFERVHKNRTMLKLEFAPWENVYVVFQPQSDIVEAPSGLVRQSTLTEPRIIQVTPEHLKISGWTNSEKTSWNISGSAGGKQFQGDGKTEKMPSAMKLESGWKFLMVPKELDYRWGIDVSQSEVELPVMEFRMEQPEAANKAEGWIKNMNESSGWKQVKIFDSMHPEEGCSRYASLWNSYWITYYDYRIYPGDLGMGTNDTLYFRKEITLDSPMARGWLNVAAEDYYSVSVNGKQLGSGRGIGSASRIDFTDGLQSGLNEILAVIAAPHSEIAPTGYTERARGALLVEGEVQNGADNVQNIYSDASWEVSRDKVNWRKAFAFVSPPLGAYGDPWYGGKHLTYPVALWYRQHLPPGTTQLLQPDIQGEYEIYINGKPLPKQSSFPVDISQYLNGKNNGIAVKVMARSGKDGIRKPLRVLVTPSDVALKDWQDMGLWWYSGRGMYTTRFSLPPEYRDKSYKYELNLGKVNHFAEVWINGTLVETRPWQPFTVDLTKFLQPGENSLTIVVANLLANQMRWNIYDDAASWARSRWWHDGTLLREREKLVSGLLGPVRLVPCKEVEVTASFVK